jgi:CheY-like chemotaxis protein
MTYIPEASSAERRAARRDGRPSVMIIEDDLFIAMSLAEQLEEAGFNVVADADNGPDAILAAEKHKPEVIVVDVRLRSEMNGIVAARVIRERLGSRVIFATAHMDAGTRGAMEVVGYDAMLAKPYTPDELIDAVRQALKD